MMKVCKRCVMDDRSDSTIKFDENGYCNYCNKALSDIGRKYFPNQEGKEKLEYFIKRIKKENKNKKYDCIMGLSGGLDSSYLAYLGAVKWGLRILAVHIDDGYDTPVASRNIQNLCKKADIELFIIKPDAKQFNELTRAYFLAGVPNLAIPQDNVLFACLYKFAKEHRIRTFLSGGNFALECILQKGNTYHAFDVRNIKDINRKFGRAKIDKLTLLSEMQLNIDSKILRIETLRPLNYIDYNRDRAIKELYDFSGFEYYGSKHLENILTKFIQLYYFPKKFNVDKRTSHLSSMIVSGQMTREKALEIMKEPLYNKSEMAKDIDFILEKLDLNKEEFNLIMKSPSKQHTEYLTSRYLKIRSMLIRIALLLRKNIKR